MVVGSLANAAAANPSEAVAAVRKKLRREVRIALRYAMIQAAQLSNLTKFAEVRMASLQCAFYATGKSWIPTQNRLTPQSFLRSNQWT